MLRFPYCMTIVLYCVPGEACDVGNDSLKQEANFGVLDRPKSSILLSSHDSSFPAPQDTLLAEIHSLSSSNEQYRQRVSVVQCSLSLLCVHAYVL